MNARNIAIICDKNGLYSSPELNDILYLHFKGSINFSSYRIRKNIKPRPFCKLMCFMVK